ncbi:uncharacterized protein LOC124912505 [Impatiens glandulifera]|uniref:uncharacterized protein LOC124912505 n=1 Tax=Impatiens glandulifera TaxID=253017 RepID=UPI001FB18F51|nr:uncharacterized protein LOC124912505 [Impatiens glandulifera]
MATTMSSKIKLASKSCNFNLFKYLSFSGVVLYLFYLFLFANTHIRQPDSHLSSHYQNHQVPPTNITHLVFGLIGSLKAWKHRHAYIETWWRPNVTRGYLFLDSAPTGAASAWPDSFPPLRVSDNISTLIKESGHVAPIMARMVHGILETVREGDDGVRWYVMGDDDSVFFVENWVKVLAKYDHTRFMYIGGHSENLMSNYWFSFDQGFGGAGFALSQPLAAALVKNLEGCLRRHPHLKSADFITQYCVDELGVSLTPEKGIHQIDLRGDISGFLSCHPQSPLLSLHHLDIVNPIFPTKDRFKSAAHIMSAANVDSSRILQQTICYHRDYNWSWTFSVSWGYSVYVYETTHPRTLLKRPLETFYPWARNAGPAQYIFNPRWPPVTDGCRTPHVFFFDSVQKSTENIRTEYVRVLDRNLTTCSLGKHSADSIQRIKVVSPMTELIQYDRSECCDVVHLDANKAEVQIRACKDNELIA